MKSSDHLYIVSYDISDQRRWRRVFKLLHGYGDWLQLSIFQCRLSKKRLIQMKGLLSELVHHRDDHLLILDLGVADQVKPKVHSIGKPFEPVSRVAVIV